MVEGGRAHLSTVMLHELWAYREVLRAFTIRRVKVRYKQAAFGLGWAVVQPVVTSLLFAVFLGRVARVGSEGVSYFIFALVGMTVWTFFSNAVTGGLNSLVTDSGLLRKVYFPREVAPLSAVLAATVDLVPALVALVASLGLAGFRPTFYWLLAPLPILLALLFAVALSLAMSAVNVYYRDVGFVLPFVLQVGLFATPIIYSLQQLPRGVRASYGVLNPVAAAIDTLRRLFLHGTGPQWSVLLLAYAWTFLLLLASYSLFKRLERGFSDRV